MFDGGNVVSVDHIMDKFNVSIATARRDLSRLEEQQLIKKVYGGAIWIGSDNTEKEAQLQERLVSSSDAKAAIGRFCANMVQPGEFIFIDGGTTTAQIAKHLKRRSGITVLTNSQLVINELSNTDVSVISLGGELQKEQQLFTGSIPLAVLESFQVSKCFLAAAGVNLTFGFTDYLQSEIEVRRKMLSRSAETYFVLDHTKFFNTSPRHICNKDAVTGIITDEDIDPDIRAQYDMDNCPIIIAKHASPSVYDHP